MPDVRFLCNDPTVLATRGLINFGNTSQAKKVQLTEIWAIDFDEVQSCYANSIHSIYPSFYGHQYVALGDSSICDRLFLRFILIV